MAARTDPELRQALAPALARMQAVIRTRVASTAQAVRPEDPAPLSTVLEVSVRLVHGVAIDILAYGREDRHDALYRDWMRQVRLIARAAW